MMYREDRELDALVGKHVFGWVITGGETESAPGGEGRAIELRFAAPQSPVPSGILPYFSIDIATAWLIVLHLRTGYEFRMRETPNRELYAQFAHRTAPAGVYHAVGSSDARNICLAALATKGMKAQTLLRPGEGQYTFGGVAAWNIVYGAKPE